MRAVSEPELYFSVNSSPAEPEPDDRPEVAESPPPQLIYTAAIGYDGFSCANQDGNGSDASAGANTLAK